MSLYLLFENHELNGGSAPSLTYELDFSNSINSAYAAAVL